MSSASVLAPNPTPALRQRRAVRNVILACVAVLLLGQLLIGALSLGALKRLETDSTADRIALIAGRTAGLIQAGLQMGKPLAQYFGLSLLFEDLQRNLPGLRSAAVVLTDGTVIASTGGDIRGRERLIREIARGEPRARLAASGTLALALPLDEPGRGRSGALVVEVGTQGLPDDGVLWRNVWFLLAATAVAAVAMAVIMRRLPVHRIAAAGWVRLAVPLGIMLVAQALYAAHTVQDFRGLWQSVIEQNARLIGEGLERDLEKVLGYGIPPERMRGVEKPMARAIQAFPLLGGMDFVGGDGRVLVRVGREAGGEALIFTLEALGRGETQALLRLYPDDAAMQAAVRARALDAATIAVVAMVAAVELMLMLQVFMDRAFSPGRRPAAAGGGVSAAPLDDPSRLGMVARPAMFVFLFAMCLPLGFLPLYARDLLAPGVGADAALLVALPTAAEMAAGLAMALLAGRLIDRRGWLPPATWGMALSVTGCLACALSQSLWTLALARAVTGLGYGLVWMALQGFVVNLGPAQYRGRNMSALIAGLFAGHMTGAAVGGMLAGQIGQRPVFYLAAALVVLAAFVLRMLLWPYREAAPGRAGAVPGAQGAASVGSSPVKTGVVRLLCDRGFAALLAGSIIPFSIAQVGLLSYALPLYFDALGAGTADVGRVIMLYGFCVIYIGPLVGRRADGARHWKHWITAGGFVGAAGLLLLQWEPGVWGVTLAVALLALASCLAGAAQTQYMLARERVRAYGAAGATGVMRGADKFGQMLGPLVVGGLFTSRGMSEALVWTGVIYLAGTLLFWLAAPRDAR